MSAKNHTTEIVPNPPSPKLLDKIGATNLTLADAIAELVANSFDHPSQQEDKTRVSIEISQKEIIVTDNGVGMTKEVLVEAVKLGVDMSKVVKKNAYRKGKFGLGMKTACASMGRWWAVHTRPEGADIEYRVEFDLKEWQRRPDSADAWRITLISHEHDSSGPLGRQKHGTALIVRDLRDRNPIAGAVLTKLGESFKPHLADGDEILVNGDAATPYEYEFVAESKIPINIVFGQRKEYQITGWVAIDKKTHNGGDYGFNIYRERQLVQLWNREWFRNHLMTSRIIGEVHMDFIDATFFKQGLQQNNLWKEASEKMKAFLIPVVKASEKLSKEKNIHSAAKRKEITDKLHEDLDLTPPTPVGTPPKIESDSEETKRLELPPLQIEAKRLSIDGTMEISLHRTEQPYGEDSPIFDYIEDEQDGLVVLTTVLNSEHPLFQETKDKDQLRKLGTADSILRYLVDRAGLDSRKAVSIRNKWLMTPSGN